MFIFLIERSNLTQSDKCARQAIAIYDEKVSDSNLIERICGKVTSFKATSRTHQLAFKITTNLPSDQIIDPELGYEIRYRSVCCKEKEATKNIDNEKQIKNSFGLPKPVLKMAKPSIRFSNFQQNPIKIKTEIKHLSNNHDVGYNVGYNVNSRSNLRSSKNLNILKKSLGGEKKRLITPLLDRMRKQKQQTNVHLKHSNFQQNKNSPVLVPPKGFIIPDNSYDKLQSNTGDSEAEVLEDEKKEMIGQYILIGVIVCCVFFLITMLSVLWRLYCNSYFDQEIKMPKQ